MLSVLGESAGVVYHKVHVVIVEVTVGGYDISTPIARLLIQLALTADYKYIVI